MCFKEVNEGRVMDVLYMDFRKAFDELPHGRLIYRNGINGIHNGFRENKGFWWKIVILADRLWPVEFAGILLEPATYK